MQTKNSVEKVLELHDVAVIKLKDFIDGDAEKLGELEIMRIKAAMTAFNGSAREMATWRATEAVQLGVIREITKDQNEIRKYVKATMPDYYPNV